MVVDESLPEKTNNDDATVNDYKSDNNENIYYVEVSDWYLPEKNYNVDATGNDDANVKN